MKNFCRFALLAGVFKGRGRVFLEAGSGRVLSPFSMHDVQTPLEYRFILCYLMHGNILILDVCTEALIISIYGLTVIIPIQTPVQPSSNSKWLNSSSYICGWFLYIWVWLSASFGQLWSISFTNLSLTCLPMWAVLIYLRVIYTIRRRLTWQKAWFSCKCSNLWSMLFMEYLYDSV